MLREWAGREKLEAIERALRPPIDWRDPITGLPAGFDDEADEWAQWERQVSR